MDMFLIERNVIKIGKTMGEHDMYGLLSHPPHNCIIHLVLVHRQISLRRGDVPVAEGALGETQIVAAVAHYTQAEPLA
ncbi:MAG: hypothetical protein SVV80_01785 [Planctomycetota bacterium]|nr:hypothetical protein [Planctomycetota bacterium]